MDTIEGLFAAGESELDPIVKGIAVESYLVETIIDRKLLLQGKN